MITVFLRGSLACLQDIQGLADQTSYALGGSGSDRAYACTICGTREESRALAISRELRRGRREAPAMEVY